MVELSRLPRKLRGEPIGAVDRYWI